MALLLRADAEQRWLHREVIPVLSQLETQEPLPGEQVGAALAYLEDSWNEALLRARQTDAARECGARSPRRGSLGEDAMRYHTAVRALRGIVARRVTAYVDSAAPDAPECAWIA
jgi:hypothetical protein